MADITLPQLGETVTEGTITRWFKKVGDTIAADEPLFEVSTDKVDTEVPSPVAGTLTEIRVAEGETVAVGTVIAVVGAAGAAPAPAPVAAAPAPVAAAPAPAVAAAPAPVCCCTYAAAPAPVAAAPSQTNKLLSPVVRRLVTEHQIAYRRTNWQWARRTHYARRCFGLHRSTRVEGSRTGCKRACTSTCCLNACSGCSTRTNGGASTASNCTDGRARASSRVVQDSQIDRRTHGDVEGSQPTCIQRCGSGLRQC